VPEHPRLERARQRSRGSHGQKRATAALLAPELGRTADGEGYGGDTRSMTRSLGSLKPSLR
jgi:hypothetical protein